METEWFFFVLFWEFRMAESNLGIGDADPEF